MGEGIKVGEVCVVMEYPKDNPRSGFLYGVFTNEKGARKDYGDEDENHRVEFVNVPLWMVPR